jgi:hypothetical protein
VCVALFFFLVCPRFLSFLFVSNARQYSCFLNKRIKNSPTSLPSPSLTPPSFPKKKKKEVAGQQKKSDLISIIHTCKYESLGLHVCLLLTDGLGS